jgi:hypothetical protein
MHYKNGREAKNGDLVLMQTQGQLPFCGVLIGATPGNNTCNGNLIYPGNSTVHYANLAECLHVDDIAAATIPDSSAAK